MGPLGVLDLVLDVTNVVSAYLGPQGATPRRWTAAGSGGGGGGRMGVGVKAGWSSRIGALNSQALAAAAAAVEKAGVDVEAHAKALARVDTGAMQSGIEWQQTGPLEGQVVATAEHTIYNEFGTRHMPAKPMLTPAAEQVSDAFERALSQIFR